MVQISSKSQSKLREKIQNILLCLWLPIVPFFRVNKYQVTIKDINDINQILDKILSL